MSRRRKRKKATRNPSEDLPESVTDSPANQSTQLPHQDPSEESKSPSDDLVEKELPPLDQDEGLNPELDDYFETDTTPAERQIDLPTADEKIGMRSMHTNGLEEKEGVSLTNEEDPKDRIAKISNKRERMWNSQPIEVKADDLGEFGELEELSDLDDAPSSAAEETTASEKTVPPAGQSEKEKLAKKASPKKPIEAYSESKSPETKRTGPETEEESPSKLADEPAPQSPPKPSPAGEPLGTRLKQGLRSLSLVEKVAIGLVTVVLTVAAIWSITEVSARIPNTVEASKLKFPLKGDYTALANLETYWRSPIREGADADEGVSETVKLIPEIVVTLDPKSQAKALRFLFQDENGRYSGDASTVKISGANFLPSDSQTADTKGASATVRATTGFQHEGEIISYLADDQFQWELIIFESKDGRTYQEFISVPISAIRKD